MKVAKAGDRVQIHYTGRLEDGTVFDNSHDRAPLAFTAGGSEVISGVSQGVLGMQPGESKNLTVDPENGYGQRLPDLERRVPRKMVPQEAQAGDQLKTEVKGETVILWIMQLSEDFATLDLNHPLAGCTLAFDIELVSIESKPA